MNKNLSDSIKISVNAAYISEQSNPENDDYIFAYTVTIKNIGDEPAQLISRHWFITNSDGETHEVHGEGVVGQKPHILPGEDFRYTSGTRLDTPVGSMHGEYLMQTDQGDEFSADIPTFTLAEPHALH